MPKAVLRQEQELLELNELIQKTQLDLEFLKRCQSDLGLKNSRPEKLLYHLKLTLLHRLRPCSDREFEALLSRNEAMHQFLGISKLDEASTRPPSRSSICRSRQMFPDEIIEAFTRRITELALQSQASEEPASVGVEPQIEAWIDTTAIEPNAHHPVDWILLTDAVRFCVRKIRTIRKSGLAPLRVMSAAKKWQSQMNQLSIAFRAIQRKKDSKQKEQEVKKGFRKILNLTCLAKRGMLKVRDHLDKNRAATHWSEARIQRVLGEVDALLSNLQVAEEQSIQRILKGEPVPSEQKLLSLYEPDMRVIHRGKAVKNIEYGNLLRVSENESGLIVEWKYYQEKAPNDSQQLPEVLESIQRNLGPVKAVCADRQFDSPQNRDLLAQKEIINAICPRSVPA